MAPALAEAHDAGLTVIVKEGMANGRLAAEHAPDAVRTIAEETGLGADAVALALILRQPWAESSSRARPPPPSSPRTCTRRSSTWTRTS